MIALAGGLLRPRPALAAGRVGADGPGTREDSLGRLTGDAIPPPPGAVRLEAPETAADGRSVPVSITADLPGVEEITVRVPGNPMPVIAVFSLDERFAGHLFLRVKFAETSKLVVLVRAGATRYLVEGTVKIPAGQGCLT